MVESHHNPKRPSSEIESSFMTREMHSRLSLFRNSRELTPSLCNSIQNPSVNLSSNFSSILGLPQVERIQMKNDELSEILSNRLTAFKYFLDIIKDSGDLGIVEHEHGSEESRESIRAHEDMKEELEIIETKPILLKIFQLAKQQKDELMKLECTKQKLIETEMEEEWLNEKFRDIQMEIEELVENRRANKAGCRCSIY